MLAKYSPHMSLHSVQGMFHGPVNSKGSTKRLAYTGEHFSYVQHKPCEYSTCTLGIHSQGAMYHNIQDDSFLDKLCYLDCHLWDLVAIILSL